jgi:hypothetical protein
MDKAAMSTYTQVWHLSHFVARGVSSSSSSSSSSWIAVVVQQGYKMKRRTQGITQFEFRKGGESAGAARMCLCICISG